MRYEVSNPSNRGNPSDELSNVDIESDVIVSNPSNRGNPSDELNELPEYSEQWVSNPSNRGNPSDQGKRGTKNEL